MPETILAIVAVVSLVGLVIAGVLYIRRWSKRNPPDALDEIERDAW